MQGRQTLPLDCIYQESDSTVTECGTLQVFFSDGVHPLRTYFNRKEKLMGLVTILIIILILLLLWAIPTWPHSRSWGYAPSGGIGLILVIVLILVLMKYI